jgi:hypothetical protein
MDFCVVAAAAAFASVVVTVALFLLSSLSSLFLYFIVIPVILAHCLFTVSLSVVLRILFPWLLSPTSLLLLLFP